MNLRWSLVLYAVSLAVFGVWALWPDTAAYFDGESGPMSFTGTILISRPWVGWALTWIAAGVAGLLLLLALLAYQWRVVRWPVVAVLLAMFAFPAAGVYRYFENFVPWTVHGRVTDSAGVEYVFCDSSFLQGQMMSLARVAAENPLYVRLEALGTTNGDSPRSWASLIRPAGAVDGYGQLYLTDDERVIGLRYGGQCYMAYDVPAGKFSGHGEIEALSPFVLLSATDALHEPDVVALLKVLAEQGPGLPGYPQRGAVEAGLTHVNPRVRELAARVLEGMREGAAVSPE